jgi:hypothetical protein
VEARAIAGLKVVANLRGHLAIASTRNIDAALPDLRSAGASAASHYDDWKLLQFADSWSFFSDPLADATRLLSGDKLIVCDVARARVGKVNVRDHFWQGPLLTAPYRPAATAPSELSPPKSGGIVQVSSRYGIERRRIRTEANHQPDHQQRTT